MEGDARLRMSGWRRLALAVVAFGVVTAVTVLIAHPRIFTGFSWHDDEGYMLITLKSFANNGGLYDDVFAQYGPFYYEAWGGLFTMFGIPISHDSGRAVTLIVWVVTSLTIGLATLRMTRSILLGITTQMIVFAAIVTLVAEPMHPGGIICLLLAAIVAISTAVRTSVSAGAMGALGIALAALVLVKINVGIFALAAVVLVCTTAYPALVRRRWLRLLVEVAFVATPAALMVGKLGEGWVRDYAFHVTIAALAVVIVLRARESDRRADGELWWLGGGFLAGAAAILAAALGSGTSIAGLLDGIFRQPLGQADAFSLPLVQSGRIFLLDAFALGGALTYWYVARARTAGAGPLAGPVTSILSVLVGVELGLAVIGKTLPFDSIDVPSYQLALLSFAWVALIPFPGAPSGTSFARLLLPPLAVLQALHAFPVAGSQVSWSAFLLAPVSALCVANGVRGLAVALDDPSQRRAAAVFGSISTLVLVLFVANVTLREPLRDSRAVYRDAISLNLPGAHTMRVAPADADLLRSISAAIDANCPAFVMLPGMNSFYFWSDQNPPSNFNATAWPALFDEADQRRVIEDTRLIPGLCLLKNMKLAEDWGLRDGPLVRYLGRGFEQVAVFDDYRLLKRRGISEAAS